MLFNFNFWVVNVTTPKTQQTAAAVVYSLTRQLVFAVDELRTVSPYYLVHHLDPDSTLQCTHGFRLHEVSCWLHINNRDCQSLGTNRWLQTMLVWTDRWLMMERSGSTYPLIFLFRNGQPHCVSWTHTELTIKDRRRCSWTWRPYVLSVDKYIHLQCLMWND